MISDSSMSLSAPYRVHTACGPRKVPVSFGGWVDATANKTMAGHRFGIPAMQRLRPQLATSGWHLLPIACAGVGAPAEMGAKCIASCSAAQREVAAKRI